MSDRPDIDEELLSARVKKLEILNANGLVIGYRSAGAPPEDQKLIKQEARAQIEKLVVSERTGWIGPSKPDEWGPPVSPRSSGSSNSNNTLRNSRPQSPRSSRLHSPRSSLSSSVSSARSSSASLHHRIASPRSERPLSPRTSGAERSRLSPRGERLASPRGGDARPPHSPRGNSIERATSSEQRTPASPRNAHHDDASTTTRMTTPRSERSRSDRPTTPRNPTADGQLRSSLRRMRSKTPRDTDASNSNATSTPATPGRSSSHHDVSLDAAMQQQQQQQSPRLHKSMTSVTIGEQRTPRSPSKSSQRTPRRLIVDETTTGGSGSGVASPAAMSSSSSVVGTPVGGGGGGDDDGSERHSARRRPLSARGAPRSHNKNTLQLDLQRVIGEQHTDSGVNASPSTTAPQHHQGLSHHLVDDDNELGVIVGGTGGGGGGERVSVRDRTKSEPSYDSSHHSHHSHHHHHHHDESHSPSKQHRQIQRRPASPTKSIDSDEASARQSESSTSVRRVWTRGTLQRSNEDEFQESATLHGLPDNVLVNVFRYLHVEDIFCSISRISYRFYRICQNPSIFEEIDLSKQQLDDEAMVDLLCEMGWSTMKSLTPPLRISSRGMTALVTCQSLRTIRFVNSSSVASQTNAATNASLTSSPPRSLSSTSSLLDARFVLRVFESCNWPLVSLDLSGINSTDDLITGVANRFSASLRSIIILEHVDGMLSDSSIARLLSNCEELRSVTLRRCRTITVAAFETIRSPWLTDVDVSGCAMLDDKLLKRLARGAARLRRLNLASLLRISPKGLAELLKACVFLDSLGIAGCASLNDSVLTSMLPRNRMTSSSSHSLLTELSPPDAQFAHLDLSHSASLSANALIAVVEQCGSRLQSLIVRNSPQCITNALMQAIATTCGPWLKHLAIGGAALSPPLSETSLAMLTKCTSMRSLDLSDCGDVITARLLGDLFAAMPMLEELRLARCTGLTNQIIQHIKRAVERPLGDDRGRLEHLRYINLEGCSNVSRVAFIALLRAVRRHVEIYMPE